MQKTPPSIVVCLAASPSNDTLFVVRVTTSPKTQVDEAWSLRVVAGLARRNSANVVVVEPELQLLLGPDDSVVVEVIHGVCQHGLFAVKLIAVALSIPVVEDVCVVLTHDFPVNFVEIVGQQVDGRDDSAAGSGLHNGFHPAVEDVEVGCHSD